ncbi:MAG: hypothetical protein MUF54_01770 [Polyangiaceae bacterium]|jgi:hypothetical protein|nr:hypothetical protein [Polyangiaceae bacterium]
MRDEQRASDAHYAAAVQRSEAKGYLLTGAGVAALGAVGAVLGGAVCPLCIVATPALLGIGFYKAWRGRRIEQEPVAAHAATCANEPLHGR